MPVSKISPLCPVALQVSEPFERKGFFSKLNVRKLARHCLSKRLITVENFGIIVRYPDFGNQLLIHWLWTLLNSSSECSNSPSEVYETLKELLKSFPRLSPERKLFHKFQEMEKSPQKNTDLLLSK